MRSDGADPAALERVGTMFADRYDVLELLGIGGMGAVYRVRDRELDEIVALKVIRDELASERSVIEQFRLEVKLARRVTHANVARTFELGNDSGVLFCTMELVEGISLTERLRQVGKVPVADAVAIACAVLDGLAAAHAAHVIHRDIKPDNILLSDGRVVVADFGVASMLASGGETSGTPAYMAPEQAQGERATEAVDVYSVGIVLHEMVTGRRAFAGTPLEILAQKLDRDHVVPEAGEMPPELAQIISRATERELARRMSTAKALRRALEPFGRAQRPPTLQPRDVDRDDIATVVLVAPVGEEARLHHAHAVTEAVALALAKRPGLRVVTRARGEAAPNVTLVELVIRDELVVTIRATATHVLRLSAALDQFDAAVSIMTAAIAGAAETPAVTDDLVVADLVSRARYLLTTDSTRIGDAIETLERARAIAPHDARIAASLANAHVRVAFFKPGADPAELVEAARLAHLAVRIAPELAESHVAAGHVELHTGDPALAAEHYRKAIARSPHTGEAHEYLGRLVLEAGYIDLGLARLEDSIASALQLQSSVRTQWDIARAYALEQRWADHDQLIAELTLIGGSDRSLLLSRFGWWRGDLEPTRVLREAGDYRLFEKHVVDAMIATVLDGAWRTHRDALVRFGRSNAPNRRRRTLAAQLVAETAGFAGDVETCIAMITHSTDEGLFDMHWLDKCPTLACARDTAGFVEQRTRVLRRAEAILDAFYGDRAVAMSATALATSA